MARRRGKVVLPLLVVSRCRHLIKLIEQIFPRFLDHVLLGVEVVDSRRWVLVALKLSILLLTGALLRLLGIETVQLVLLLVDLPLDHIVLVSGWCGSIGPRGRSKRASLRDGLLRRQALTLSKSFLYLLDHALESHKCLIKAFSGIVLLLLTRIFVTKVVSGPTLSEGVTGGSDLLGLLVYIEVATHVVGSLNSARFSLILNFVSLVLTGVKVQPWYRMLLLTHNVTGIANVTIPSRLLLHSCGILVLFLKVCTDFLISFLDFLT